MMLAPYSSRLGDDLHGMESLYGLESLCAAGGQPHGAAGIGARYHGGARARHGFEFGGPDWAGKLGVQGAVCAAGATATALVV